MEPVDDGRERLDAGANLTKYIQPLLRPIVATPSKKDCKYIRFVITMRQSTQRLHPQLMPTTVWTYNGLQAPLLIRINRYQPVKIKWINRLPSKHLFEPALDPTLMDCSAQFPAVRTVVHLHGHESATTSDGAPLDWYTRNKFRVFRYMNQQPATVLFAHDHAVGITRLNILAGLFNVVYDLRQPELDQSLNLPQDKYEIPLLIADRQFQKNGQIFINPIGVDPPVHPNWRAAYLGDCFLVNGRVWPYLRVKRRRYRFRVINACDSRTVGLSLRDAETLTQPGPRFLLIGTDGGLVPKPLLLSEPLFLSPAERADIIVDFSKTPDGSEWILLNTARPFFDAGPPFIIPDVMKFIVRGRRSKKNKPALSCWPPFYRLNPRLITRVRQLVIAVFANVPTRPHALLIQNRFFDFPAEERPLLGSYELWQFVNIGVGSDEPEMTGGSHPMHVHLIQFQLLARQPFNVPAYFAALLAANPDLQPGEGYNPVDVSPFYTGPPVSPASPSPTFPTMRSEDGWKDTIRAPVGFVTSIIIHWAPQDPKQKRFPFNPCYRTPKSFYVFHCHMLSHEDNDMMRPYYIRCKKKKKQHYL